SRTSLLRSAATLAHSVILSLLPFEAPTQNVGGCANEEATRHHAARVPLHGPARGDGGRGGAHDGGKQRRHRGGARRRQARRGLLRARRRPEGRRPRPRSDPHPGRRRDDGPARRGRRRRGLPVRDEQDGPGEHPPPARRERGAAPLDAVDPRPHAGRDRGPRRRDRVPEGVPLPGPTRRRALVPAGGRDHSPTTGSPSTRSPAAADGFAGSVRTRRLKGTIARSPKKIIEKSQNSSAYASTRAWLTRSP